MKVAVLLLAVAVVGAFAEETSSGVPEFVCTSSNAFVCKFQELGHHIKYHASKLGGQLKDVGSAVLSSALDQGKNLLANGAQAVLGTVLEHLTKEGIVGKREIAFFDKIKEHVANGVEVAKKAKETLHKAFEAAVDRLTGVMSKIAGLKQVEAEADKEIDDAVAEFNKEGKKGFVALAGTVAQKLQTIFSAGMDRLRAIFGKKVEERAIFGFGSLSDAWEKAKEHLSNVAGTLADTFKPHVETLKSGISALADKAKEHAGNLADAAKASFNDLKDKLSTHVENLKGHAGKLGDHANNAINALKEAISSIALQTVSNVKDTVNDAISTGKDAADTVKDHVSNAVSGY